MCAAGKTCCLPGTLSMSSFGLQQHLALGLLDIIAVGLAISRCLLELASFGLLRLSLRPCIGLLGRVFKLQVSHILDTSRKLCFNRSIFFFFC